MRKPAFCIICKNESADQLYRLCGNRKSDQRLPLSYRDSSLASQPLKRKDPTQWIVLMLMITIRYQNFILTAHSSDYTDILKQYNPSTSQTPNFKLLYIFCDSVFQFTWDLVENPKDRFSHDAAHILSTQHISSLALRFLNQQVGFIQPWLVTV